MKIYLFIFFISFVSFKNTTAQDFYIKYGMDDCINSNMLLHSLSEALQNEKVHFLFKKMYESDSTLLINQFGIHEFDYELHFSDSLFNHFKNGEESYFIAKYDDYIKSTKLKALNLEGVIKIVQEKNKKEKDFLDKPICLIPENSDNVYELMDKNSILSSSSNLNRFTYYDLANNNVITIIPDSNWTKMGYELFYGKEKYRANLDFFLDLNKSYPAFRTELYSPIKEDNKLYFLGDIKIFDVADTLKEKLNVNNQMYLFVYDLPSQSIYKCIPINFEQLGDYYIANDNYVKSNNSFYFFINPSCRNLA